MPLKRPTGEALAAALAAATGYVFRDFSLMSRALTHSSAQGKNVENNERLEFLGDRVLGLVISDLLIKTFPQAPQGELADRFNALVSGRTCAEIGHEIGLDSLIRADNALRSVKGRRAENVVADAMEALIAAIYVEAGLEPARQFILRYWEPRARAAIVIPRDAKNELQEWTARHNGAHPVYSIDLQEGSDHEPVFTVRVEVEGFAPAFGTARSKRAAERAAASALLLREGVWTDEGI